MVIKLLAGKHKLPANTTWNITSQSIVLIGDGRKPHNETVLDLNGGSLNIAVGNDTGKITIFSHITLLNGGGLFGGAVVLTGNPFVKFKNVTFLNNTAEQDGGALYFFAGPGSTLDFDSVRFSGNSAINGGAAVLDLSV